nr:MAG: hypothetical protein [Porcellio scaber clopovirus]
MLFFEIKEPTDEHIIKFYSVVIDHMLRQIFSARCEPNTVLNLEFGYGGLKLFQNDFLSEEVIIRLRFIYLLAKKYNVSVNMFCESGGNIIGLVNWLVFSIWESCARCEEKRKKYQETPLFLTFCSLEETDSELLNKKYERICKFLWRRVCPSCVESFVRLKCAYDYFISSAYSDLLNNCVEENKVGNEVGDAGKLLKVVLNLIYNDKRKNIFPNFKKKWKRFIKRSPSQRPPRRSRNLFETNIHQIQKCYFPSYIKTLIRSKNSFKLLFLDLQNLLDELLRNHKNYEILYRENIVHEDAEEEVTGSFSLISVLYSKSLRKCVFIEMKSPFEMKDFLNEEGKIFETINSSVDFTGWFNPRKDIVDVPVFFGKGFNFDNVKIIEKIKMGDNFSFSYTDNSVSIFDSIITEVIGTVSMSIK